MNQRTLKLRIGLFLLLALALFTGSLFFFGLTTLFEKQTQFVSFFNESVKGLNTGSLVRFRGVEVGQVQSIRLSLGKEITRPGIPVIFEIDISRLQSKLGVPVDISEKANYEKAIRDGLTAKLANDSMVTGQLFIDLDFRPKNTSGDSGQIFEKDLYYIPSVPSLRADVTEQMVQIIDNISRIDFPGLSTNLNQMIVTMNATLQTFEDNDTAENFNKTLLSLQKLIDSGDIQKTTRQFGGAAGSLQDLLNDLNSGKGALGEPLSNTLNQMAVTAESMQQISQNFSRLIESNTGPVADVEQTLQEIQNATAAFQSLLEFLRRHPNALIFGKQTP